MNRREQLFQQCEDDIFSLLMLDYAEQEGARLEAENQRLKQDPEAAIPDSAYQKGLKPSSGACGPSGGAHWPGGPMWCSTGWRWRC